MHQVSNSSLSKSVVKLLRSLKGEVKVYTFGAIIICWCWTRYSCCQCIFVRPPIHITHQHASRHTPQLWAKQVNKMGKKVDLVKGGCNGILETNTKLNVACVNVMAKVNSRWLFPADEIFSDFLFYFLECEREEKIKRRRKRDDPRVERRDLERGGWFQAID